MLRSHVFLLGYVNSFPAKVLLVLFGLLSGSAQLLVAQEASLVHPQVLKIFNWSEYLDPEVVNDFESKYQVEVKEFYFESDEDRTKQLAVTGGQGYDIIVSDMPSIRRYAKQGWLEKITPHKFSNYHYISENYLQTENFSKQYAVPLLWGTLGIAYRKDLVKEPITS